MGTNNFASTNTSQIFAVQNSDEREDVVQYVKSELEELAKKEDKYMFYESEDIDVSEGLHSSYHSESIGSIYTYVEFKELDEDITVAVVPKTTAGYYYGFTLDYLIAIESDETSHDDVSDMVSDISDHPENFMTEALEVVQADIDIYDIKTLESVKEAYVEKIDFRAMEDKLDEVLSELADEVEKIFRGISTPLVVMCSASNGEVAYAEATD